MVFQEGGLLSGAPLYEGKGLQNVVLEKIWSLMREFFHRGGLSLGGLFHQGFQGTLNGLN